MLYANETKHLVTESYNPPEGIDVTAKMRIMHFTVEGGTAADSEAVIAVLPAGNFRILPHLCHIGGTGLSGTVKVGHNEYYTNEISPEYTAAVTDSISTTLTAVAGTTIPFKNAAPSVLFNSRDDVQIRLSGTIAVGALITGYIVYTAL